MKRTYLVVCVVLVLVTMAATAFSVRASDSPTILSYGVRDTELLQGTLDNSTMEVEMSKMALERSKNKQIRALAEKSISEHTRTIEQVKQLASGRKTAIRLELKVADANRLAKLSQYTGADFESLYLMSMNNLHGYDLQRMETLSSTEPEVGELMKRASADAREHLSATRAVLQK